MKNLYGVVIGMGRKVFGAHLDIQRLTIPVGLGTPVLTAQDRCLTNAFDFFSFSQNPEAEKWTIRVLDNRCP